MKSLFVGLVVFLAMVASYGCINVDLYEELGKTQQLVAGEPLFVSHLRTEGLAEYGTLSPQSDNFVMSPGDAVAWQIAWPVQAKGIEICGYIKYRTLSGWITEYIRIKISGKYIGAEMLKCFAGGTSFDGVVVMSWGAPKEEDIMGSGKEISLAPGMEIPGVSINRTVVPVKKLAPTTWGSLKK